MFALLLAATTAADLGFLAGTWQGKDFEAVYTTPAGGMVLSVSKEFADGKVAFFELERFVVREGVLTLTPFLNGKETVSFPLHDFKPGRAHFRNARHDFPQDLVYERVSDDELRIVLSGVEGGKARTLRFELHRAR